jgi:hypothetical protein
MAKKQLSLLQQQKAKLKKQRALATTPKAKAIVDRRIQRVTVQIQNAQKQLTGASPNKALPAGRTTPTGRPSTRRTLKAAQLERAKQGTKGTTTRTGQPAGSANRKFGANVVDAATQRAQRSSAVRGVGRNALRIGKGAISGRGGALTLSEALKPVTNRIAKEAVRGAKVVSGQPNSGKRKIKNVGGTSYDISTPAGRRGYDKAIRSKYPTTANTKTVKKSRDYQAEAKAKAKAQSQAKSKPAKDRGKRDYGSKEANLAAWAKANPKLAKRLEEKKKAKAKRRAGGTLYSGRTGNSNMA